MQSVRIDSEFPDWKVGRILRSLAPDLAEKIIREYTPLSQDITIIPKIHKTLKSKFPGLDDPEEKTLLTALVYRIFCPQSFLRRPATDKEAKFTQYVAGKLPIGARDEVSKCLGFNNSEMVAGYKLYAEAHIKNKRYRAKMKVITDELGLTSPDQQL